MRKTISGRRPVDGADTPGGVFRPGGVLTCLTKLLNAVTLSLIHIYVYKRQIQYHLSLFPHHILRT